ncbi:prephenate dehydratase [Candidatus Sulfidibacterium hydrothermale]|uniref:prephenate dehydratase n=1 Tax=Candidatus Sulfidibacterium hydrothermale TaxID=2875962 RepID=UPI001F0A0B04|nr:prephenate dehydratase [Candidatus Sulfidibacterium hydrothermale]UBM62760.1 prephenate dehydratase [Candidatus Sulfidibacterium hydrothermale]
MIKIAMQGVRGAFHEIAIRKYFNHDDYEAVPCASFNELFDALRFQRASYGMVAIENSIVGSILPNYTLLRESGLRILGEVYLRIEQHLLALPGQKTEDIKKVYSHPMALQQCREFLTPFRRNGVQLVDSEDTALSARWISEGNMKGVAAIASRLAAKLYHLDILAEGIETNKMNYTRFLVVSDDENYKSHLAGKKIDKASLCFILPHQQGRLSEVLSVLSFYKINLSKIQSLPIVGQEWEYLFYVDVDFSDFEKYRQSLDAIRPLLSELTVFGEYEKGEKFYEN